MTTPTTITDGKSAWAEFFAGVTETFDANESSLPLVAAAVAVLVVLWLNVRLAKWILRRWEGQGTPRRAPSRRSRST